jgi:hypothetical protein
MAIHGNCNGKEYEPLEGFEPNETVCASSHNGKPLVSVCCPICRREVWLTQRGIYHRHNRGPGEVCPQSGTKMPLWDRWVAEESD